MRKKRRAHFWKLKEIFSKLLMKVTKRPREMNKAVACLADGTAVVFS
jgi:hypothetical protein